MSEEQTLQRRDREETIPIWIIQHRVVYTLAKHKWPGYSSYRSKSHSIQQTPQSDEQGANRGQTLCSQQVAVHQNIQLHFNMVHRKNSSLREYVHGDSSLLEAHSSISVLLF